MRLSKLIAVTLLSILIAACGGGGGGGKNANKTSSSQESAPSIYEASNYENTDIYDGTLQGVWVLVEKSTVQFDLDDFSAEEGFFETEVYRRTLISLYDDMYGIDADFCVGGEFGYDLGISLSPDNIAFSIGNMTFEGVAINNNHIEGQFSGRNEDDGVILNSEVTLHKLVSFDDMVSDEEAYDFGDIDISYVSPVASESLTAFCFDQFKILGENYIDGGLVSVDADVIFVNGYDYVDDSFADFFVMDITADNERAVFLGLDSSDYGFFTDEDASLNLTNNTLSKLKGVTAGSELSINFDLAF